METVAYIITATLRSRRSRMSSTSSSMLAAAFVNGYEKQ